MTSGKTSLFWMRRDIRIDDNTALNKALASSQKVLILYIFDENTIVDLPADDARISFIHDSLKSVNDQIAQYKSSILCCKGTPIEVFRKLTEQYAIDAVYANKEYEPYSRKRDTDIDLFLKSRGIALFSFKDQVIFEENEVVSDKASPYSIFTPYKNKWLSQLNSVVLSDEAEFSGGNLLQKKFTLPTLEDIGFVQSEKKVKEYDLTFVASYHASRDFPSVETSNISPHLRYGTVSIRRIVAKLDGQNPVFLSELIWREFFMQALFQFPFTVKRNFKSKYDAVRWRNDPSEFEAWCQGLTGYPIIDAGMRQLNKTGYMHNRIRMVVANFLCKILLVDWRWGEAYFAQKLIDFELSSNVGNWQWSAGTGCDSAPYFRIFNPYEQQRKFDSDGVYIRRWVEDFNLPTYPAPIVDYPASRLRALETYKQGLNSNDES